MYYDIFAWNKCNFIFAHSSLQNYFNSDKLVGFWA